MARQQLVFASGDGERLGAAAAHRQTALALSDVAARGMNVSPLVTADGRVYVSHSEENTGRQLDGRGRRARRQEVGRPDGQRTVAKDAGHGRQVSSPVMLDDRALRRRRRREAVHLRRRRPASSSPARALGTGMRSTPLVADGKIYLCTMEGRWYILKPTDDGVEVVQPSCGSRAKQATVRRSCRMAASYVPTSEPCIAWAMPIESRRPIRCRPRPRKRPSRAIRSRPRCKSCRTTCRSSPGEEQVVQRPRLQRAWAAN